MNFLTHINSWIEDQWPSQKTSMHLQGLTPISLPSNHLWQKICRTQNLDQAFDWLCEQTDDDSSHSDVWEYRQNWSARKLALQMLLKSGQFNFQTVRIIEITNEQGKVERCEIRCAEDRLVIRAMMQVLQPSLQPQLSPFCTHLKGNGGLKLAVRDTQEFVNLNPNSIIIKSDVKSYYANIDHFILAQQLAFLMPNEIKLQRFLWQFMRRTTEFGGNYQDVERGLPLGASISPLLAGVYLSPLDALGEPQVFYRRYMDGWLMIFSKRQALKKVVKAQYQVLQALRVEMHPDKTFIGQVKKGFDFLGFHCCPTGLRVSDTALSRRDKKVAQLYEQGASKRCIAQYLVCWLGWASLYAPLALATTTDRFATKTTSDTPATPDGSAASPSTDFFKYFVLDKNFVDQSSLLYSYSEICRTYAGTGRDDGSSTQPDFDTALLSTLIYTDSFDSLSQNTNVNSLSTTPTSCLRVHLSTEGPMYIAVFPPALDWDTSSGSYRPITDNIPTSPIDVSCPATTSYNDCRNSALTLYHDQGGVFAADAVPSDDVTLFTATTPDTSSVTLTWEDAGGDPEPHGYQVACSMTDFDSVSIPSNGDWNADESDCSDGSGSQRIRQGAQTLSWSGLDSGTYYFKIVPFTNQMSFTQYKTNSPDQVSATITVPPGITITESSGGTSVNESGTTDSFDIVLDTEPVSNVELLISSVDIGEATVNPSTLTFTPSNWDTAQTITATGVNDDMMMATKPRQ